MYPMSTVYASLAWWVCPVAVIGWANKVLHFDDGNFRSCVDHNVSPFLTKYI